MIHTDADLAALLADPLAPVRAGAEAIGFVGADVPLDLLLAAGRRPVHLPWRAGEPTPTADAWMEPSFAPWAASILEQWATGAFDVLETVVFSRGDDSAQRLYYYLCELQRRGKVAGPRPLILDVARIGRATSEARLTDSLRRLAGELGVDGDALKRGIADANEQRATLAAIAAARGAPGARYERIARASLFAPVAAWNGEGGTVAPGRRVLLAGTPPPDDRLHRAVDAAGWTIVGEAHERGLGRLGPAVSADGDPFEAIAVQMRASRFGPRTFADPAAELVGEARRVAADVVVLWLIEQEESIVWHVPAQTAALQAAGLPALVLTRRRWDASDGAGDEIATFLKEQAR